MAAFSAYAKVGFIDTYQAYYRKHAANMHYAYRSKINLEQIEAAYLAYFENPSLRTPEGENLKQLAFDRLAERAFWAAYNAFDHCEDEHCKGYLDFAIKNDPDIKAWKSYRRLPWKLLLGSRRWAMLKRIPEPLSLAKGKRLAASETNREFCAHNLITSVRIDLCS